MPQINTIGRHNVIAKTAEFGESNSGTPFLCINFEDNAGASIRGWIYLSEKALANALKTLREAFNFDGNFETAISQVEGKACAIVCELESDDKGTERLKVKWINPISSGKPLADPGAFLKSLTAKAARLPAPAPKAGSTPPRSTPPPAARPPAARPPAAQNNEPEPF